MDKNVVCDLFIPQTFFYIARKQHAISNIPDSLYLLSFKYRDGNFFHSTYSGVQSILFACLGDIEGCFRTTGPLRCDQLLTGEITLSYEKCAIQFNVSILFSHCT